jgi:hypothetical protein
MSTPVPICNCLNCKIDLNEATLINGDKLRGGDVAICFFCGYIMAVNDDLTLRELTQEEMYDVAGDKVLLSALNKRADFWQQHERADFCRQRKNKQ